MLKAVCAGTTHRPIVYQFRSCALLFRALFYYPEIDVNNRHDNSSKNFTTHYSNCYRHAELLNGRDKQRNIITPSFSTVDCVESRSFFQFVDYLSSREVCKSPRSLCFQYISYSVGRYTTISDFSIFHQLSRAILTIPHGLRLL